MYSSTESTTASAAAHKTVPKNLVGTFQHMWRLMFVVAFYWLLMWGSADLMNAFFRSIVVCAPPTPTNGRCPIGSVMSPSGECEAVPKTSRDWSGSVHCADKLHVTFQGTATSGKVQSVGNVAQILSQVFVGAAMLDTLGRKPVLLMGLASTTLFAGMLWFSCHLPTHIALSALILGSVVCKLADSFTAATAAMVADLSSGDKHVQGLGFSAVNILRHAGIVLAFAGGFPILSLYLEDYTMVWGMLLVLACAAVTVSAVLLRETHSGSTAAADTLLFADDRGPSGKQEQLENGSGGGTGAAGHVEKVPKSLQMVNVMAETGNAFRAAWDDGYLRGCMSIAFLGNCAAFGTISIINGYGLEVVKLRQQVVSLAGVFQPLAIIFGSYSAAHLFDSLGEVGTYALGTWVLILGLVTMGAASHFRASAVGFFWAGLVLCGIGFGLSEPAFLKLVSRRIGRNNSGKIFSVKMFMDCAGTCFGTYVWSNYMFQSSEGGDWMAGLGMFVSAGMMVVVFMGLCILYARYLR